jgi:class 3 adenylate cyclase
MGECEVIDNKVGGLAVNIGSRICGLARPSEVLASQTIKDLVAGTGLWFEDRGAHELKGVPGEWRLFTLENGESGAPATARSPRAADSSMRGDS